MTPEEATRTWERDLTLALDPVDWALEAGFVLDPWQVDLVRSTAQKIVVLSPRQRGKSLALAIVACRAMLYSPGTQVLVVSKSLNQSHEWLKRLKAVFAPFASRWAVKSETAGALLLHSGSRVLSVPKGDAARGYSPNLLLIDEAAFIPDEDIAGALPTVNATHGRIIAATTPGRSRGWAWSVWQHGEGWERHHVRPGDSPRFDPGEEARNRADYGEERFRREFLAEWVDDTNDPKNALVTPDFIRLLEESYGTEAA